VKKLTKSKTNVDNLSETSVKLDGDDDSIDDEINDDGSLQLDEDIDDVDNIEDNENSFNSDIKQNNSSDKEKSLINSQNLPIQFKASK